MKASNIQTLILAIARNIKQRQCKIAPSIYKSQQAKYPNSTHWFFENGT